MNKDKFKIAVELLLKERGYTREEIKYGVSFWKNNIEFTGTKIRNCAERSEDFIKHKRDEGYKGTPLYQGIAYFWAYKYRHYMRDATYSKRKLIHNKFLAEGLELTGETERHDEIINKVFNMNEYKQEEVMEYIK